MINVCCPKLAKYRKTSNISSIFIKTFWISFSLEIFYIDFFFSLIIHNFWVQYFFLGCNVQKSGWPISVPHMTYYYHPQKVSNNLRKLFFFPFRPTNLLSISKKNIKSEEVVLQTGFGWCHQCQVDLPQFFIKKCWTTSWNHLMNIKNQCGKNTRQTRIRN